MAALAAAARTTKATESACRTCAYVPAARVREQGGKSEREACLMATRSGLCPPGLQRGAGVCGGARRGAGMRSASGLHARGSRPGRARERDRGSSERHFPGWFFSRMWFGF